MTQTMRSESAAVESLVARVVDEFLERQRRGDQPLPEEYADRHPEHAGVLREVLAALRLAGLSQAGGPSFGAEDDLAGTLGDFRIVREVGRGGMGVVYEAVQLSLSRRVALKVLPFAATMDPKHLQRFHNEARAAASLHHPHIVPVHGVGQERGVHFYAMQFIDGRTLAEVIARQRGQAGGGHQGGQGVKDVALCFAQPMSAQGSQSGAVGPKGATGPTVPTPAAPRPERRQSRPLSLIGDGKGSDTAPAAAADTEVGPRDAAYYRCAAEWGIQAAEALEHAHSLGIVHRDVKPANLMIDGQGRLWVTDFGLARTAADSDLTLTGDLLGTLRYMAPEQALAKHGLVDHRTDVYSLGVTLYELLTLSPSVNGRDRQEVLRQIAFEDPKNPRSLNRHVPHDLETVVLKSMAKCPLERYASAKELAEDLRRWLEHRPVAARRPTFAQWGMKLARRHRAVVATAAACLLFAFAALGAGFGWVAGEERARQGETRRVVTSALGDAEERLRRDRPQEALAAALRAEGFLRQGHGDPALREVVEDMLWDVRLLLALEQARLSSLVIRLTSGKEEIDAPGVEAACRAAFEAAGLDVLGAPEAAARRMRERRIAAELAGFLDYWATVRRNARGDGDLGWRTVLQAACECDPDPERGEVREALRRQDKPALSKLLASGRVEALTSASLLTLAMESRKADSSRLIRLLDKAHQRRPDDFWVNSELGIHLMSVPGRIEESVGYLRAAVALRRESAGAHLNLGTALRLAGRPEQALQAFQEAVRLKPDFATAHKNVGGALYRQKDYDGSVRALEEAVRLNPDYVQAHADLGRALAMKGDLKKALLACGEAIRLDPNLAEAYHTLGVIHGRLGKADDAVAAYRQAVRLRPEDSLSYCNLGSELSKKGDQAGSIRASQEAIRLNPTMDLAHFNLGAARLRQGEVVQAVAAYRRGLQLKPADPTALNNLASALASIGEIDEAIAALEQASRLNPNLAEAYLGLGALLVSKGRFADALAANRRAHDLGAKRRNWPYPTAGRIRECEALLKVELELPAFLAGERRPGSPDEAALLAHVCAKNHPDLAVRYFEEAFAGDPALAKSAEPPRRYNAACAAVRAAANPGAGDPGHLLREALVWLRADLNALAREWRLKPFGEAAVRAKLCLWQRDRDLAAVRDGASLAKLGGEERAAWAHLWAEVRRLESAGGRLATPPMKDPALRILVPPDGG